MDEFSPRGGSHRMNTTLLQCDGLTQLSSDCFVSLGSSLDGHCSVSVLCAIDIIGGLYNICDGLSVCERISIAHSAVCAQTDFESAQSALLRTSPTRSES